MTNIYKNLTRAELEAKLAEGEAKIEELTAVAEFECVTWVSATPNPKTGNCASPINLPKLSDKNQVIQQNNAAGYKTVAGLEQRAWLQVVAGEDKNGSKGYLVKLTGPAETLAEFEAKNPKKTSEAEVKTQASTEVPF